MYGVTVGRLNEAVKRNRDRSPADFMFQLSREEFDSLRSKLLVPIGGSAPFSSAFTEQAVAMLSSVLHSKRAVQVNIEIVRTFVRLRRYGLTTGTKRSGGTIGTLEWASIHEVVFDAIRQLMAPPKPSSRKIGFLGEEKTAAYGWR
jgi:hypothetical protein